MTNPAIEKQCPHCGEWTSAIRTSCQACGKSVVERPVDATDFLLPRNVSTWSMLACYIGLVSCIMPLIGAFTGLLAIVFAGIALAKRRKGTNYGAVTSDLRAVFGLIFGIGSIVLWAYVWYTFYAK